ncbi:hypothetical protein BJ123_14814 [Rhodopseudomonas thermotolerans]|uniref:Uncharacterized protein n=2 Tax=Rhodopseudomonas TaxID=1073 RepID=A0A336JY97_9BRAD|nr:hypothetical protein BJ125_14815 [Rhodopseudomonas pentothenatexigens]REF86902.1 hypothetical protein BJ123_14814 [Rhodopseudomonas thermotolerans]SSW93693.1 hypothetical protein SAMN05892882_14815 [Rhodopseudomonas pentothenatexigens]
MAGPSPRRSGFGRAGGTSPAMTRGEDGIDGATHHFSISEAVITDWAISAIFFFSFIAVERSST